MRFEIISAFIDKRTGRQVEPGEAVPEGLSEETLERLVQARCLMPLKQAEASSQSADTSVDLFGEGKGPHGGEDAGATEAAAAGGADGADIPADRKAAGGRRAKAKK